MSKLYKNRYLISRRIVQITILGLFVASNIYGFELIMGNLSAVKLLDSFYLADPYAALQMLSAGMLISVDILIGSLIIVLFYGLFAGRAFCSWVCPMNIVTDSAYWLRRKIGFILPSNQFIKVTRKTRYWILASSFIVSLVSGVAAFEFISPISMLHRGLIYGIGTAWLIVLMVFLYDLLIMKHGWCGYLCPLGAFYSLIGKYSILKIEHFKEACTDCNDCKLVCPEVQVLKIIGKESGYIANSECSNCGRCIDVCEDKALKYSLKKIKL
jgi:ferredoxin-type protein NapH